MALAYPNKTASDYIRVASLAVAFYDYLMTLPAEWSIYHAQYSRSDISVNCVFFVAIRYASIAVLCVSSYDFFYDDFTSASCRHWYLIPEGLKGVQAMVAQAIMAWRVYVVSRRKRAVKWSIIGFYVVACAGEWVTNILYRRMVVLDGNCRFLDIGHVSTAWLFYLIASIYDIVTLSVVVLYLYRVHSKSYIMSRLKKILIYYGLVYFLAILAGNLLNMVIYLMITGPSQTACVPLSYVLTWIFSQKILIDIHKLALSEKESSGVQSIIVTISRSVEETSRAVQTSFDVAEDSLDVDMRIRTTNRTMPAVNSELSDISKV